MCAVNPDQPDNALRPDSRYESPRVAELKRLVSVLKDPQLSSFTASAIEVLRLIHLETLTASGWDALQSQPLENL